MRGRAGVARGAHNPEVTGSNPVPATKNTGMTIDPISSQRAQKLHPFIKISVMELLSACYAKNVPIRIVQGFRTIEEQNALYSQGRTLPGKIITNAKGGDSWHNYGLAIDFCLLRSGNEISWNREEDADHDGQKDWHEVVDLFIAKGFEWGGNWTSFPDYPHFQKTMGLTIRKAKELYDAKKIDNNGYLIL